MPQFQDVQLRVFDLSNTNEPVLVLTANAQLPSGHSDLTYMIALVARQDIYGDLHKAFAQTADSQHLDVVPKYELIDAVDADGDGRGELLFRLTSDAGPAFAVYRVIGDQLWPLFEGKHRVQFSLKPLPFVEGRYYVTLGVHSRDSGRVYHVQEQHYSFAMVRGEENPGLVYIPVECRSERL